MTEYDYDINLVYGRTPFKLGAKIEYHSAQIMRIRVYGKHNSILLENNFPLLNATNSKKGIKWKLREGSLKGEDTKKDAALLWDIMTQLEEKLKNKPTYQSYQQREKY